MIVAIYESIYFMHALKDSVEEKEMLKRESLQAQLNALRTQVNPHFLFNNLNTLSSLIPEDPKHAVDFCTTVIQGIPPYALDVKEEKKYFTQRRTGRTERLYLPFKNKVWQ